MGYPKCKARSGLALELDRWHHPPSHMKQSKRDI